MKYFTANKLNQWRRCAFLYLCSFKTTNDKIVALKLARDNVVKTIDKMTKQEENI